MNGKLTAVGKLNGTLSGSQTLSGTLSGSGSITGHLDAERGVQATIQGTGNVSGRLGMPLYTGSYTVQPGQTLYTAGRMLSQNVTGAEITQGSVSVHDVSITANPSLTVDQNGQVSASVSGSGTVQATVEEGYITEGAQGNVTVTGANTLQLTTKGEQTYEANYSPQTIQSGVFLTGNQTIKKWDFHGFGLEYVSTVYAQTTVALKDTLFNGWTPSTTAKTIVSSATAGTFTADMVNYEYLLKWIFDFNNAYISGATLKVTPIRQRIIIYQGLFRRPSNIANLTSQTFNGNASGTLQTVPIIKYYNSTGAEALAYTGSYGIYCSATSPSYSNATANSPTVTIKTPSVSARCSTTYMATARASEIDQTNAKYTLKGEIWRTSVGGALRQMYEEAVAEFIQ